MKCTSVVLKLLSGLIFIMLAGCTGAGTTDGGEVDGGSSGNNDEFDTSEFFVGVGNGDELRYHNRTFASFTTKCSIPTSSVNQDLNCIIDVPEGDLQFNGIDLKYNVPAGICRYIRRETYSFYNQEIGVGPSAVEMDIVKNASGDITSIQCGVNGGALGSCATLAELSVDNADESVKCKYDLTLAGKANCCLGDYILTKTTDENGVIKTTTTPGRWGGDVKTCLGGAGRTSWTSYSKDGFPRGIIEYAYDGLDGTYEVKAPIETPNDIWNISVANFYTPATHSHDGYVDNRVSTLPYFIDPVDDRDGTLIPPLNAPYRFECLNEAYEIQNRINLYVREWDVYTDYLAYIASSGVTAVPDRPGEDEPADCDGVDGVCNDRWDLDDFISEYLTATYETATAALRRANFPEQDYD